MALQSFNQWLSENGKRTCLGAYPPGYGSFAYPPLYFAPISASHAVSLTKIHGDEHPELLSPEMRKEAKKKKKGFKEAMMTPPMSGVASPTMTGMTNPTMNGATQPQNQQIQKNQQQQMMRSQSLQKLQQVINTFTDPNLKGQVQSLIGPLLQGTAQ